MEALTLNECTKEELIEIINRVQVNGFMGEHLVESGLIHIEAQRMEKKFNEAEKYNKLACEKRLKSAELMKPYEGKRWSDVPMEILTKASELLKEAEKADKMWNKLMNF